MTPQEIKYENKRVRVIGFVSHSGTYLHRMAYAHQQRCGAVVGEAKNGMLLVAFDRRPGYAEVAIPAHCVEILH